MCGALVKTYICFLVRVGEVVSCIYNKEDFFANLKQFAYNLSENFII